MPVINILGVPSSAGSYAPGQERAPEALRAAGLVEALQDAGLTVHDAGDLTVQVWAPDRQNRYAQNVDDAARSVCELATAATPLLGAGQQLLVLGGNCLVALGLCAALRDAGTTPRLVYVDRHFDLNTPSTTTDGTLDWMGMAHALGLPGTAEQLLDALGQRPLLTPDRISFLGVDPMGPTEWELQQVSRLFLPVVTLDQLVASPTEAARAALAVFDGEPFAVHVDVDVLDFIDAPIAENVNGRNTGPTVEQLGDALIELCRHPSFRGLSIGEINPAHAAADPAALPRFIRIVVDALSPPDAQTAAS